MILILYQAPFPTADPLTENTNRNVTKHKNYSVSFPERAID